MPRIEFPNVPAVAGVPALLRLPTLPAPVSAVFGVLQGSIWRSLYVSKQWGIFKNGKNVLETDKAGFLGAITGALGQEPVISTNAVQFQKEFRVSDFPIEAGGFASYNKVELPSAPSITIAMSGTESQRTAFLDKIESLAKSMDVYDIVLPEKRYLSHTIESYKFERTSARGAYLLFVDIRLKEIRTVSLQAIQITANAKAPSAKPTVSSGKVQGKTAGKATENKAIDKAGNVVGKSTTQDKTIVKTIDNTIQSSIKTASEALPKDLDKRIKKAVDNTIASGSIISGVVVNAGVIATKIGTLAGQKIMSIFK